MLLKPCALLLSIWIPTAYSYPHMILDLTKKSAKCVTVNTPAHTLLEISYQIDVPPFIPQNKIETDTESENQIPADPSRKEGEMKNMTSEKNSIEKDDSYGIMMDIIPDLTKLKSKDKNISPDIHSVTHLLDQKVGKVLYETIVPMDGEPFEGDLQICVHTENSKSRVLFSLRIHLSPIKLELSDSVEKLMKNNNKRKTHQIHTPSEIHEKTIEQDLESMLYEVDDLTSIAVEILRIAENVKDADNEIHRSSEEMLDSLKYWPIIHFLALLIIGVYQAKHMINFFKAHNII